MTAMDVRHEGAAPIPHILADTSLEEAILVLLLGLSGAQRSIRVTHRWDHERLLLHVCDGEPMPPEEHPDVVLAKSTIARFGGTIAAVPESDGRSCVEMTPG